MTEGAKGALPSVSDLIRENAALTPESAAAIEEMYRLTYERLRPPPWSDAPPANDAQDVKPTDEKKEK